MVTKMSKPVKFGPPASTFGFGLLMGAADAVPGVSGGTIALILGIYRKLISSISACLFFVKENLQINYPVLKRVQTACPPPAAPRSSTPGSTAAAAVM